jgi:hypothetical protein
MADWVGNRAERVPSLPKTVRATRVPLRLGSVIPDKTP